MKWITLISPKFVIAMIFVCAISVKNAWLWAAFDQSFSYSGGLIESCPKPGTFDPLPPFAIHILNPLDMRIHRDPLYMGQNRTQKCLEANTSQVFGNCGSLSPPPTINCPRRQGTKSIDKPWQNCARKLSGKQTLLFR